MAIITVPIKQKLVEFRVKNLQVFKAFYDDAALIARIRGKAYSLENPLVHPMRPLVNTFRGYLTPDGVEPTVNPYDEFEPGFNVTYSLNSYENSFILDKADLEIADPAFLLIPKIKAAQDGVIKEIEKATKNEVLEKAHEVSGGTWVSTGSVINPIQIEDDIKTMVKQIKNSVVWAPEDFDKLTLYLPVELKVDFKEFDGSFRTTTVEDIIKKYVADIKYTPLLENTAVMMIKNDPYGLTKVEHEAENMDSPYEKIHETDEIIMYKFRVRSDVKVIPDPKHPDGKTYRIIKVENIIG